MFFFTYSDSKEFVINQARQDGQFAENDEDEDEFVGQGHPGHGTQDPPASAQFGVGVAEPLVGPRQHLPLRPQLLDDSGADLLRLDGHLGRPVDALRGALQDLGALLDRPPDGVVDGPVLTVRAPIRERIRTGGGEVRIRVRHSQPLRQLGQLVVVGPDARVHARPVGARCRPGLGLHLEQGLPDFVHVPLDLRRDLLPLLSGALRKAVLQFPVQLQVDETISTEPGSGFVPCSRSRM